jgi:hypothetical protein
MEKINLKIDNIFSCIIHSSNYRTIYDNYDNVLEAQKEVFKKNLIPRIKEVITEVISNNKEYQFIKIEKVTGKYTKKDKIIHAELIYNNDRENINVIYLIFQDIKREIADKLIQYELLVF